jgi:transcriptional regulator EpsA
MGNVIRGKPSGSPAIEIDTGLSANRFGGSAVPIGFAVRAEPGAFADSSGAFELTRDEIRSFLRIIARSLHVKRHYELFQLVQGEVQDFIPHRILVSAWGDFDSADLKIDVVSAIPGVRTNRPSSCDIERLLRALYVRWLAHGRQPLLLHNTLGELFAESNCRCTVHEALHGMGAALVHGNHNARDGTDSLYLVLNSGPITKSGVSVERFRFLADLIISQLDTAFRKVAALKRHGEAGTRTAQRRGGLSLREEEIIDWVAKGRTNAEISGVLAISEYTVKNHVRRIMKKLGAANRTEAVAKFRRDARDPRTRIRGEGGPLAANRG